jgi:hypothetical protein
MCIVRASEPLDRQSEIRYIERWNTHLPPRGDSGGELYRPGLLLRLSFCGYGFVEIPPVVIE